MKLSDKEWHIITSALYTAEETYKNISLALSKDGSNKRSVEAFNTQAAQARALAEKIEQGE